jgi:4-hydroxy-2-oxoheptanedioate aldolase
MSLARKKWPEFVKRSNEDAMIWLLVEGVNGINNFDRIIEVPKIDAIMMGPFDLSQSLGYPGQTNHPAVVGKIEEMVRKLRAKNIDTVAAMFSKTPEGLQNEARHWGDLGCRIIAAGSDRRIISAGFRSVVDGLKPLCAKATTA